MGEVNNIKHLTLNSKSQMINEINDFVQIARIVLD